MIGHRTRFRENDDLPLLRGPAVGMRSAILGNDLKLVILVVKFTLLVLLDLETTSGHIFEEG